MTLSEEFTTDEIHPIDLMEQIAAHQAWEFERVGEDHIAMTLDGQWRAYTLTLAWCGVDQSLRLMCSFAVDVPQDRAAQMLEVINDINHQCWTGSFNWWAERNLVIYRYALMLDGGQVATPEQLDRIIRSAVHACERYYPALQLVSWANRSAKEAMQIAICEAYGHA